MAKSPQSNPSLTLSGPMDTRFSGVPTAAQWSYLLNVDGGFGMVGRLGGWQRYLANGLCPSNPNVSNHDLHDQLDGALTSPSGQEYITMLYPFTSSTGRKRLIAGTRTKVLVNDDNGGNWRILAYGLGGTCVDETVPTTRFRAANIGDNVIITNGVDYVMSWTFDTPPIPLQGTLVNWSCQVIPDLLALNVNNAKLVAAFQGFILLADLNMDGVDAPSRILWSDYNNATSFFPGGQSLAGYHDLGHGETVIAMLPLGGAMQIYTTQAIYQMQLVNDSRVFTFNEIYRIPVDGPVAVPFFRNAVVSTGQEHYWLGGDSVYMMTPYDRNPQKVDWIYAATGAVFNGLFNHLLDGAPMSPVPANPINFLACENVIGGYAANVNNGMVWFSFPTGVNQAPDTTLVLWPKTQKATFVDAGFTAFCSHTPDLRVSLREFVASFGICNPASSLNPLEAIYCTTSYEPKTYPNLYNSHANNVNYPMDPNSAIAAMCGVCLTSLCTECTDPPRFLMASTDKTIKQFEPGMQFREAFTGATAGTWPQTSTGSYSTGGYTTFAQSMPTNYGTNWDKLITALTIWSSAPDQTPQGQMNGQIGLGNGPFQMDWWSDDAIPIGYQSGQGGSDADGARDGPPPSFRFHSQGIWYAFRFWVTGTGNAFTASQAVTQMELASYTY